MLLVSRFRPDPERLPEWIATLWQGQPPSSFTLRSWLIFDTEPASMLMIWEAPDDRAKQEFEAAFVEGGELVTEVATDATPGMAAAFVRDLDAFGEWMQSRGTEADEIDRALDLRRRGLCAQSREEARAAGRAWATE